MERKLIRLVWCLDGQEICPRCFGAWWEKVSQPQAPAADSDIGMNVSVDTASV